MAAISDWAKRKIAQGLCVGGGGQELRKEKLRDKDGITIPI